MESSLKMSSPIIAFGDSALVEHSFIDRTTYGVISQGSGEKS
jgi:hypothetical protein